MHPNAPTIAGFTTASHNFDLLNRALQLTADEAGSGLLAAAADPNADLTLFAPTDAAFLSLSRNFGYEGHDENEAFDAIVAGLTALTGSPEAAVSTLNDVLSYHVSAGAQTIRDLSKAGEAQTLLTVDGQPQNFAVDSLVLIDADDGLANPTIVTPNIYVANGVVQVIDEVLIPLDLSGLIADQQAPSETIAEIAAANGDFDLLVKALQLVDPEGQGLLGAAADPNADLTVFAPTDAAFISLARNFGYEGDDEAEAFDALVAGLTELTGSADAAIATLSDVLSYHIAAGAQSFEAIRKEGEVETLLVVDGEAQTFEVEGKHLIDADLGLDNPRVIAKDIPAANGAIQAIDEVLIPIDLSGLLEEQNSPAETIAEIASTDGNFDLLVKALALVDPEAEGLLGAAADAHADLTVFAPTDAAFISLARNFGYQGFNEEEAFDALVEGLTTLTGSPEAAVATLSDVLSYHVSPGAKTLQDIRKAGEVETLLVVDHEVQTFDVKGRRLIDADDGLDDPRVVTKNIEAANGTIQAIDEVLIPIDLSGLIEESGITQEPPTLTIAETAAQSGEFDILVKALQLVDPTGEGLLGAAADPHADLTVFAPTDAAFLSLASAFGYEGTDEAEAFDALVAGLTDLTGSTDAAIATLSDVLSYHISPGAQSFKELRKAGEADTLLVIDGETQSFDVKGSRLIDADDGLQDPRIVAQNIETTNGVIQGIDAVLIPIDLSGLLASASDQGDVDAAGQTLAAFAMEQGDQLDPGLVAPTLEGDGAEILVPQAQGDAPIAQPGGNIASTEPLDQIAGSADPALEPAVLDEATA